MSKLVINTIEGLSSGQDRTNTDSQAFLATTGDLA